MSHTKHGNEAPAAEREAAAAEREGLQMKAIEWLRGKLHIEPDESLLEGYCVLMVENMGLAAWKVK